jgi:hypothetical protein
MMLIATTVAVALFASTVLVAGDPAASSPAIPPMIVNVTAAPDMSSRLVAAVLAEAEAIWRPSGVTFIWRRTPAVVPSYSRAAESGPYVPNTLRLTIGDNAGVGRDGHLPLGWILFDMAVPEQEIYLSHANAKVMMDQARGVVGIVDQMTIIQRETLLARAMGRALSHELGHYLLASKVHTERGLMKAVLTAVELFSSDVSSFRIEPAQRLAVAARLRGEPIIASR